MSAWTEDCNRYWGRVLTGTKKHWCPDWDYLPIDETTKTEIDCCTCDLSAPERKTEAERSQRQTSAEPVSETDRRATTTRNETTSGGKGSTAV